ncbi:phenylalanine--tRNA ligase subunit beta [Candidatus Roizmanbacteria bacterium CG_4_9_14_0_2_um_filter_39_13]|uniref:phenylalanine--tRNA ligase n=1 Tax=Candidatus Roizmanbacteria bacterium CG_4_9_14_0_2_um_filter_39_13 TaxID=1974839 RepID=A0A2M8F3B7_9BACT|nr:MAG: phenylalanine--tRNA ligase subunit beta [Candidatus Roizmanbacteria bacterium CG_4_10_14_0_2_um_filter_39_12]PJC33751.1 MAG: phenylalanine--tRNA ligase subunit beta [Candidatus Roizmanbacteria bacterium CG_4_9_14_0_2_um_filter_39_13]
MTEIYEFWNNFDMNIKITYDWLLEYLDTDADPYELQKYLSLCGPSIETVEKVGEDYVFDIEITTNRIDMASVFGVAQEAQAILPMFGKRAKLKKNPLNIYSFETLNAEPTKSHKISVQIEDHDLVPRFTAIVLDNVLITKSPEKISRRLQLSGIKSINNVVDISNYLMLSLGQPVHMFDYDQIQGGVMKVRRSIKGEKLTTLDAKELTLPGDDIVIEDGSGKLIDLCGIMGGENSSITSDTTRIVFFVQTYDKKSIRKTSMQTGQRTLAATYFEKGLDPERVESTFVYGMELLQEMTQGVTCSELTDIYPHKKQETHVKAYLKDIQRVIGVAIEEDTIISILSNLDFHVVRHEDNELAYPDGVSFDVTVPTYRVDDVSIQEDIIEEVARVYGYHNLPNNISPLAYIKQPKDIETLHTAQYKIKYFLKHLGLHEFLNYSMVSGELLTKLDYDLSDHLKIANTISSEIEYMRLSLLPSLIKNMKDNFGRKDVLKLFEIAKVYEKRDGDLPKESYRLAIAINTDFDDLKGIVSALLRELNIDCIAIEPATHKLMANAASIRFEKKIIGMYGKLHQKFGHSIGLTENIYIAEIEFEPLMNNFSFMHNFLEPAQYAVVKLDLTVKKTMSFQKMVQVVHATSSLLRSVEYVGTYEDNITLRFFFSSPEKNITEDVAKQELEQITKAL